MLDRYLDHACECGDEPLAGVHFAESLGRTPLPHRAAARPTLFVTTADTLGTVIVMQR